MGKIKCGNCDYWHRGGYGAGRGGGSCTKWNIPKVASNTCGAGPRGCHSSNVKEAIVNDKKST